VLLVVYITSVKALKVVFLIDGCTSDIGWNYNILQAILDIQTEFDPDGVVVEYQESVTVDTCVDIATTEIANGADMIFFPTGSFEPCAKTIAGDNPSLSVVVQNSGTLYPEYPNLAVDVKSGVFAARFIVGVLAGTQNNIDTVCFMAPFNYGSLKRWSNAILLGIRNVSATDKLVVGLTNDFDHTTSERNVTDYFDSINCDVIIQHQDSLYPQLLANSKSINIYGIGWGADMGEFIGDNVLTSIVTDWRLVFSYYIQKKLDDVFISESFVENLFNGALYLTPYSKEVKHKAKKAADQMTELLTPPTANPFCGCPVQEQYGTFCTTESNLIANYLPGITVYNGVQ